MNKQELQQDILTRINHVGDLALKGKILHFSYTVVLEDEKGNVTARCDYSAYQNIVHLMLSFSLLDMLKAKFIEILRAPPPFRTEPQKNESHD